MHKPCVSSIDTPHQWQRMLNRATELDDVPSDPAADLADILKAAEELAPAPDADWH